MSVITLNVDEARRTLSCSDTNAFVINDKNVDIVRFALLTGFANISLDEHSALRVMYQRPGETTVRAQTLTYYDTDGIHNFYDWELLAADLTEKGILTVALCILRTDTEVEEWHTTPYQIRVLGSIHTDDSDEGDETITPTVAQRVAILEAMTQRLYSMAGGAPVVVTSVSEMTDTEQIYVLTTDGKWYYYDGSVWTAGGTYGAIVTDTTLTQSGVPADAKAVGDALAAGGGGLTDEIAVALLNCFAKVAWSNPDGQEYYDDLLSALVGDASYFKVTSDLVHVKISNKAPYVIAGESYTATLTAEAGYTIGSVSVTHGGAAVTVTNNTFTIPSVSGDIVITASATQTVDLPMLHYWDLTRNLNDTVGKKTATLGGASRNTAGLTIASASQYADFPDVWGANRTIEVDVSSYVRGGTGNGRLFTYRSFSGSNLYRSLGFIFHNAGKWSFYKGSWIDFDNSDSTYISGKTVKFEIDSNYNVSVYVDNVLLGTVESISFNRNDYTMGFGSESYSGYTCTITSVRVYEGVES